MVGLRQAVAFGFVLATVGVAIAAQGQPSRTPKQGVTKSSTGSDTENTGTTDKEVSRSPNVTVIVKQENPASHKSNEAKDDENIAIQRKLANFTFWLVVVGLIQALILASTVYVIWQQIQTSRNIERAWIEGEITKHEQMGIVLYSLTVKNNGKTPAQIFGYELRCGRTRDNAKITKWSLGTPTTENVHAFIAAGEPRILRGDFDIGALFSAQPSEIANAEGIPKGVLWVTVKYGDVVGKRRLKWRPRTTDFVYLYDLMFSYIERSPEYNDYT